jgi:hypothetical protein
MDILLFIDIYNILEILYPCREIVTITVAWKKAHEALRRAQLFVHITL